MRGAAILLALQFFTALHIMTAGESAAKNNSGKQQ
jgi:hypothetical protein